VRFTYDRYVELVEKLKLGEYEFCNYFNWPESESPVVLRHDIDNDIGKALCLAKVEHKANVKSTYFVLLSSEFYNVFSNKNREMLLHIHSLGHEIGLHFDEMNYPVFFGNLKEIVRKIEMEAGVLSEVLGMKIRVVSMHRPSKRILDANLEIPGIVNSYSRLFLDEFKYVSDSRRRWREPIEEYVEKRIYRRLHILTHAFWYSENEMNIHDTLLGFVNRGAYDRYNILDRNFTDLGDVVKNNEVVR